VSRQQDQKSSLQHALDRFITESRLSIDEVRTMDADGIIKYGFSIEGTTCLVSLYDYTQDDLSLPYLFAEFGVGIVPRSEADQKITEACAAMYDCSYPLRVGVPPFDDDCLLTLALRCEAGVFQPAYLIEVIYSAAGIAAELRKVLQIETLVKARAS
jgi:hypothetical protein